MKKNILFVDDEPEALQGLRLALRIMSNEWELYFVSSGKKAQELIKQVPFHVVVSDMHMPEISGAELLREVSKVQPNAGRIIFSGYTDLDTELSAVRPAHQFINKPCKREDLIQAISVITKLQEELLSPALQRVFARSESLPVLPYLYLRVEEELAKKDASIKKIGRLIEKDASMSSAILKVVNSAFFGLTMHVSSPSHAVTLLGLNIIKGIILGIHLFREIPWPKNNRRFMEQLHNHSFRTGVLARRICSSLVQDKQYIDKSFIAGLLHDIGKLILLGSLGNDYDKVLRYAEKNQCSCLDAEKFLLHTGHVEVGTYLLGLWGFDRQIIDAVRSHHQFPSRERQDFYPGVAVYIANALEQEQSGTPTNLFGQGLDYQWLENSAWRDYLPQWRAMCSEMAEGEAL